MLDFNEGQNTLGLRHVQLRPHCLLRDRTPIVASTTAGYGLASFLLGDASSGNVIAINPISTQGLYYAAYVQDDWKVTSRLTINMGLRWDVEIGDREKYNRLAYFNPTAPILWAPPAGLPNL